MNKTNKSLAYCFGKYTGEADSWWIRSSDGEKICGGSNKLSGANAELFCQTLKVTHETGKTPRELLSAITEINDIIFGFPGAPLGSVNYFKIREICCNIIWPQK